MRQQKKKSESIEAYIYTAYVAGLSQHWFGQMLNNLHNAFRMGQYEYPKDLTSAYDQAINWKGYKQPTYIPPNNGLAFIQKEEEEGGVHANIVQKVQMIRSGNPVECHIYGTNHYTENYHSKTNHNQLKLKKVLWM